MLAAGCGSSFDTQMNAANVLSQFKGIKGASDRLFNDGKSATKAADVFLNTVQTEGSFEESEVAAFVKKLAVRGEWAFVGDAISEESAYNCLRVGVRAMSSAVGGSIGQVMAKVGLEMMDAAATRQEAVAIGQRALFEVSRDSALSESGRAQTEELMLYAADRANHAHTSIHGFNIAQAALESVARGVETDWSKIQMEATDKTLKNYLHGFRTSESSDSVDDAMSGFTPKEQFAIGQKYGFDKL